MATVDLLVPPTTSQRDPSPRLWTVAEFERMRQLGLFAGHTVDLVGGTVMECTDPPHPFVFTRKEYHALGDSQFFRDQRVQLIGGVILEETAVMNPPHAVTIRLVSKALEAIFSHGFDVRCQLPLNLGQISEPEPDVAVVPGSPRDYFVDHPRTALLVVEVSETTIHEDTHDKASLYATGGIADYWVVDLTTDRVLVFRSPAPDAASRFGMNYASVSAHGRDDKVTPLAVPQSRIAVSDLLP
ncbi:hypothetical protein VT84_14520 [Gemmata sp. SH-PL17]|uniref:Uma2 family endonuclease n=1 Tax=Gemmata sp. SH-PL17 TaxID=1630693 RepID=UPI00078E09E7|nr:Uma2 family endonuclease [Gemmata sp. SH-PL17]AMV25608.1 hypothetical protein VT84_14520 [Gemmata sp. SH-PL17]